MKKLPQTTGSSSFRTVTLCPPPGRHGGHLLGPQQERPPGPGAGGLLHSGPAQGDEEDHLHRSVTFNPTALDSDLRRPPLSSPEVRTTDGPRNRYRQIGTRRPPPTCHPRTLTDSSDWLSSSFGTTCRLPRRLCFGQSAPPLRPGERAPIRNIKVLYLFTSTGRSGHRNEELWVM